MHVHALSFPNSTNVLMKSKQHIRQRECITWITCRTHHCLEWHSSDDSHKIPVQISLESFLARQIARSLANCSGQIENTLNRRINTRLTPTIYRPIHTYTTMIMIIARDLRVQPGRTIHTRWEDIMYLVTAPAVHCLIHGETTSAVVRSF
jgi:hypothetical protein